MIGLWSKRGGFAGNNGKRCWKWRRWEAVADEITWMRQTTGSALSTFRVRGCKVEGRRCASVLSGSDALSLVGDVCHGIFITWIQQGACAIPNPQVTARICSGAHFEYVPNDYTKGRKQ